MRYKHIILFAMILVSKVCCTGEYWWDEAKKCFNWYGTRPFESIPSKQVPLPGGFIRGAYSFRPIPEDKGSAEPQIVIEFDFIPRTTSLHTLHDILVKKITFKHGALDDNLLKAQSKVMGKMMVKLFIAGLGENITHYEMLRMFYRFVFALNTELNALRKSDLIETLSTEFAAGMTEGAEEFHLDTGFSIIFHSKIKEDKVKLVIKLTQATADLVCDTTQLDNTAIVDSNLSHEQHTVDSVYSQHKTSLAKCLYKKHVPQQFTPITDTLEAKNCRVPFGEYFFNLFMKDTQFHSVQKDDALGNLFVIIKAASEEKALTADYIGEMAGCITKVLQLYEIIPEGKDPFADLNLPYQDDNSLYNSFIYHIGNISNNIASYFNSRN